MRVVDGIGEIVGIDAAHVGFAAFVIEALHLVLAGVVQINGFLIQRRQSRGKRYFGDHLMVAGHIHYDEVVA